MRPTSRHCSARFSATFAALLGALAALFVAYASGVVHEVDAAGQLLQVLTWPAGKRVGYVTQRARWYGPPAR